MKMTISDVDFAKALSEKLKESEFGGDDKFRLAVEVIAKEILLAAEFSGASPPAITNTALGVVTRAAWYSFHVDAR